MSKLLRALVIAGMVVGLFVVVPKLLASDEPPPVQVVEIPETVQGKTAADWHAIAAHYLNGSRQLHRALVQRPSSLEALRLAAIVYHVSFDLLYRKASCESTGRLYGGLKATAKNKRSTAAGLGQFLDSTWQSTPFRSFSVYSPYANALGMGWMHAHGRGGEWAESAGCWR